MGKQNNGVITDKNFKSNKDELISNKEKQIEEMAKVLNECCNRYDENGRLLGNKCSNCECWCDTNHLCTSYNTKEATALYNAGYRKVDEDVVPRSEVEDWKAIAEAYQQQFEESYEKHQVELNRAKQEVAREIFEELIEALQGEIDAEDKQGRNAWEHSDIEGYHIHEYAEDKLDTFKIALSLYKKKYIGE